MPGTPTDAPAQPQDDQSPQAGAEEHPGFLSRGRLRRRARFLRKARELAYRDLGGLVYNLHRFGQRNDPLVLSKLTTLGQIDTELRTLEEALRERSPLTVLREAGITTCPRCAAIHGSEDRFCPNCGLSMSRGVDLPIAGAPPAEPLPAAAAQVPGPADAAQGPVVPGAAQPTGAAQATGAPPQAAGPTGAPQTTGAPPQSTPAPQHTPAPGDTPPAPPVPPPAATPPASDGSDSPTSERPPAGRSPVPPPGRSPTSPPARPAGAPPVRAPIVPDGAEGAEEATEILHPGAKRP